MIERAKSKIDLINQDSKYLGEPEEKENTDEWESDYEEEGEQELGKLASSRKKNPFPRGDRDFTLSGRKQNPEG